MKILVVDDNQTVLNQLLALLTPQFNDVVIASNGLDAQEKIHNDSFDLIIVDHLMPLMNGINLLKNLQQQEGFSAIPTIFMTTQGSDKIKELIEQSLCDFIVDKPLDEDLLLSLIEQLNKKNTVSQLL